MAKFNLKELLNEAKRNLKKGPTKNNIWAFVCFGGCLALFIYWICVLASF